MLDWMKRKWESSLPKVSATSDMQDSGTERRWNQSILKEINPECSLEGMMLKLKLQNFGHLMGQLIGKDSEAGKN